MEIKRLVGVTLIVLVVCSAGAEGQETGGVVQGAVVDSSGGAIPGAAVRIEGGAVSQSTTTDGQGRYRFAAVPPRSAPGDCGAQRIPDLGARGCQRAHRACHGRERHAGPGCRDRGDDGDRRDATPRHDADDHPDQPHGCGA
ncbi:MAG: carboxypeptidase regulatory-like domain-containing protein [Acidimicrobiia bacterium]|nr:carboxypeptidase regulatory-like domain-containing protein [Acidimicrobiia bacterium]